MNGARSERIRSGNEARNFCPSAKRTDCRTIIGPWVVPIGMGVRNGGHRRDAGLARVRSGAVAAGAGIEPSTCHALARPEKTEMLSRRCPVGTTELGESVVTSATCSTLPGPAGGWACAPWADCEPLAPVGGVGGGLATRGRGSPSRGAAARSWTTRRENFSLCGSWASSSAELIDRPAVGSRAPGSQRRDGETRSRDATRRPASRSPKQ